MADVTIWVLGTVFGLIGIIIILGAIKNCIELIKVEREMKACKTLASSPKTKEFIVAFKENQDNMLSLNEIYLNDPNNLDDPKNLYQEQV